MTRIAFAAVASACLLVTIAAGGCRSERTRADRAGTAEPRHPDDPLHDLMYAKLGHARAVLAGLVTEDYRKIELSALAMRRLSENTAWMVTDSVTYVVMSDEFRSIAGDLADRARAGDLAGTTADFGRLTESCVRCHRYLRKELFERDLPGKVSQRDGGFDVLASLAAAER